MVIEKVRACFERRSVACTIRGFPASGATVELAAEALGCGPARIAKTLSFRAGDSCIVLVTAGDIRIDHARAGKGSA